MGRHASGWSIRKPEGRRVWLVYFTHEKRTVERSTGETDRGEATKRAAEIYAEAVTGRVVSRVASGDLTSAMAGWLADYELAHTPGTAKIVEGYAKGFLAFFGSFDRFTAPGYAEYMRERIARVSRSTLRKELSALRGFAAWASSERGIKLPAVPGLPKRGHPGTRGKTARRRQATILTPAEVARLLAAMPEKGPRSGTWVRPFFMLMWETALRPYSTIARIEAPLHYRQGSKTLFVAREIDKARYERTIPLSDQARAALDRVVPDEGGLLFPNVDKDAMRASLDAARTAANIDKRVSVYDFRHSRISHLANSGAPLAGVASLAAHTHVSPPAIYVTASAQAAEAALAAAANSLGGFMGARGVKSKNTGKNGPSR